MKKRVLFILLSVIIGLGSCMTDDDAYSLGKFWVGFGMIEQTSSDPVSYIINLDNGQRLFPIVTGYQLPWYYDGTSDPNSRLQTGDRVLINYTILADRPESSRKDTDFTVKVNSVKKILLKNIFDITEETQDSIGNDPIIVKEVWQTDSLLNFEIKYWGRYEIHFINLVKNPGELTEDDQPVELELRHNANGDQRDIPFASFVSFRLNDIQIPGMDSTVYRVTCKDYEGKTFEYKGVYHYNKSN